MYVVLDYVVNFVLGFVFEFVLPNKIPDPQGIGHSPALSLKPLEPGGFPHQGVWIWVETKIYGATITMVQQ